MSKISRNAPCPCGSGKKYKRCCLSNQKANSKKINLMSDFDDFDKLSNQIVDLIKMGQLDEAENLCHNLVSQHPDQIDGIERMAMVFEAKGKKEKAIEYYRKAAAFAQKMPGFDQDGIDYYLMKVDALKTNTK